MSDTITALATAETDNTLAFCSMRAETPQEKAALFNAITDPDHRIGDIINHVVYIKDVYAEIIQMPKTDKDGAFIIDADGNQVMDNVPRVVIIDKDGETYQAISISVLNNLTRLFKMFGAPTWEPAIPVEVKQKSIGSNRIYTFNVRADLMQ